MFDHPPGWTGEIGPMSSGDGQEKGKIAAAMITGATLATCAYVTALNAFLCTTDRGLLSIPGASSQGPVLVGAFVYGSFAILAWARRKDAAGAAAVLAACAASAAFLILGRGRDWYGAMTVPDYYKQAMRLGTSFGGMAQLACLAGASVFSLYRRVGRKRSATAAGGAGPASQGGGPA
jgi:hypothetical protein